MKKNMTKWISFICCTVLLSIILIACGTDSTNSGSNTLQSTPTATPTPTPTPTPTIKEYTDESFTLSYPKDWTTKNRVIN